MKSKVFSTFEGEINNVKFTSSRKFYFIDDVLMYLESLLDFDINSSNSVIEIKEIAYEIGRTISKEEHGNYNAKYDYPQVTAERIFENKKIINKIMEFENISKEN